MDYEYCPQVADEGDKRSLRKRIADLERRDGEIKSVLQLAPNEKFAWDNLCDISRNIQQLKLHYNHEFPEIGQPDYGSINSDEKTYIDFLATIERLEKEIKEFYRIVLSSRQEIYKRIKEKCNLSDASISLRRENAKRMEELERKNSLKKAAYELSKVTATHSPTTNVTCSANHGPPTTTTSSGGTIEQNAVMPPSMSTPAQKNLIRRFSWENVDHKNSLKSLWDNNNSQSPKEALLETDNISVHATRRTSDPVGDSGRLNSGGSGLFSPLHGTNPYAQGVLNQKATLPNSPSKVAAAASASKGAIFVGSPTKNQNILFYPDGSAATAVQTIAAPAAAFLIRSPVKSAESAWQRARNTVERQQALHQAQLLSQHGQMLSHQMMLSPQVHKQQAIYHQLYLQQQTQNKLNQL